MSATENKIPRLIRTYSLSDRVNNSQNKLLKGRESIGN